MTDPGDCEIIICGGGAKPTDLHLASIIHCVDDEIITFFSGASAGAAAKGSHALFDQMAGSLSTFHVRSPPPRRK